MHESLDALFADDSMQSRKRDSGDVSYVGDSLAQELEFAMNDETYESDSPIIRHQPSNQSMRPKGPAYSRMNSYSGGDWGDPADDSDPDGRFADFNETMYTFIALLNSRADSAYISDEESFSDNGIDMQHRTDQEQQVDLVDRFTSELKTLLSQDIVESRTTTLIQKHEQIRRNMDLRMSELRSMINGRYGSSTGFEFEEVEWQELDELFEHLDDRLSRQGPIEVPEALSMLEAETNALTADLSLLNDTLQESRQLFQQSHRMLKIVQDACCQWIAEAAQVERAQEWLQVHDSWKDTKHPKVLHELNSLRSGFEDVCAGLRATIAAR